VSGGARGRSGWRRARPRPASAGGLVTSPPAGTPGFASFTVPGPGGTGTVLSAQTFFTTPVVIDAGADVTVDIVEDMIHTVFANVSSGVPSFDISLPLPAVQLVPSLAGAGKVEFYSPTGTALDTLMPGPSDDESGSVRVFYASPGEASYVFSPVPGPSQAWNVSPATSPVNPGNGSRAGGYLGLDSGAPSAGPSRAITPTRRTSSSARCKWWRPSARRRRSAAST